MDGLKMVSTIIQNHARRLHWILSIGERVHPVSTAIVANDFEDGIP